MVGAGFYALTGKIAGIVGMAVPLVFLGAGLLAFLNAFTYAELAGRLPYSAGEAKFVESGFRRRWLSIVIGIMVIITGVVSASTVTVATAGFLRDILQIPPAAIVILLVLLMGGISAWGIGASVGVVITITLIEISGLFLVLSLAGGSLAELPSRIGEIVPGMSAAPWIAIATSTFIAFYAYIGFEDLVNMAEEVKEAPRTLPIVILSSVAIATLLYSLVALAAVLKVSPAELAAANTPMAVVVGGTGGLPGKFMLLVSILTGLNGAMVQIVMASRVAYGLSHAGHIPAWFGRVHPICQTPVYSTILITGIVIVLALFFPLATLAQITAFVMLLIFATLNLSLIRIKLRRDPAPEGVRTFPLFLPVIAFVACVSILIFRFVSLF